MMTKEDWKNFEKQTWGTMLDLATKNPQSEIWKILDEYNFIYQTCMKFKYKPKDIWVFWGKVNKRIVWMFRLPEDVYMSLNKHYQGRLTPHEEIKWETPEEWKPVNQIMYCTYEPIIEIGIEGILGLDEEKTN